MKRRTFDFLTSLQLHSTFNFKPVEKYRPATLDEVSHQDEVTAALKRTVATGSLPHLLFHGPAGTGKVDYVFS